MEYNASNPNTFPGMECYAAARINIYAYPRSPSKKNEMGLRTQHRSYVLDPVCCKSKSDADDDNGGR